MRLRKLAMADAEMLRRWRNDPFIASRGSLAREVDRDEHRRWMERATREESIRVFVVELDSEPCGQVRFDRLAAGEWVISAYMLEPYTGRGLGVQAIARGCRTLLAREEGARIYAFVRVDNSIGRRGFGKAGFVPADHAETPDDHLCLELRETPDRGEAKAS